MNHLLAENRLPSGQSLQLVQGDLTSESSDAILNAANASLTHGAGVAGAIRRAAGPSLQRESDAWVRNRGPVTHDRPAWTSGGCLPCRIVIHTVGPVWGEGGEEIKPANAVGRSLLTADSLGLASISFPAISTGIFGFPKETAGKGLLRSILDFFTYRNSGLETVRLVLFDDETLTAFQKAWHDHFGTES